MDRLQAETSLDATLEDALAVAADAWSDGAGAKVMTTMASRCVALLGASLRLSELRPAHGRDLLAKLPQASRGRQRGGGGLSPKSVASYYDAFRRMLRISGVETPDWPRPARTPRRKAREAGASAEAIEAAIRWLRLNGWNETADLAHLIHHTGLRASVEVLQPGALKVVPLEDGEEPAYDYDVLEVAYGAGRMVPVIDGEARAILGDRERMEAIRAVSYSGHLKRLRKAAAALGVPSEAIEPRALREAYRRRAFENSGGNGVLVAELMGSALCSDT